MSRRKVRQQSRILSQSGSGRSRGRHETIKQEVHVKLEVPVKVEVPVKLEMPVKLEVSIKQEVPVEHEYLAEQEFSFKQEVSVKPEFLHPSFSSVKEEPVESPVSNAGLSHVALKHEI